MILLLCAAADGTGLDRILEVKQKEISLYVVGKIKVQPAETAERETAQRHSMQQSVRARCW